MIMGMDGAGAVRRPGRPRDARADGAILDAAAAVLAECGPGRFTVDAVAARSGCGKATIYRRWPSRAHLLLETANLATVQLVDPDTGSVRRDMVELGMVLATKMKDPLVGGLNAATIAESAVNPVTRTTYARFVAERREIPLAALRRGVERGELRGDVDLDVVLDALSGPIFVRAFVSQMPITRDVIQAVVDVVFDGLAPTPT
jgi:AcrR family transcriptional regulator